MSSTEFFRMVRILHEKADEFVTVEELSRILGISRAKARSMLWELSCRGFVIENYPGQGHKLLLLAEPEHIERYGRINGIEFLFEALYLSECSSPQEIALLAIEKGVQKIWIVVCGRCSHVVLRYGRPWHCVENGLWMSLVGPIPFISCEASETLYQMFMAYLVAYSIRSLYFIDVRTKWPNDIVYRDKKIGSTIVERYGRYAIIGIYINTNNDIPQSIRDRAIALKDIVGFKVSSTAIARAIALNLDRLYRAKLWRDIERFINRWKDIDALLYREVDIELTNGKVVRGTIVDYDIDSTVIVKIKGEIFRLKPETIYRIRTSRHRDKYRPGEAIDIS